MNAASLAFTFLGLIAAPALSSAATLTPVGVSEVTSVDLTAAGTTNWAAWHRANNSNVASALPTYTKTGGTGTISAITSTNTSAITGPPAYANTVRGTDSSPTYPAAPVFLWSDGSAVAPSYVSGIFHSTVQQSAYGVQFSITNLPALAAGQLYRITVYGTSYGNATKLTLTSPSLSTSLDGPTRGTGTASKITSAFEFDYNPDATGDSLTIALALAGSSLVGSSHAALQGVAISIVPEPSASLLTLAGAAAALCFRRRKQG